MIAVASPIELKAVLDGFDLSSHPLPGLWETLDVRDGVSILHTGVGKSSAAAAVAKELFSAKRYVAVLSIGIAGSYDPAIGLRTVVLGLKHWLLDEGTIVEREPGWISLEEAGWAKTSIECRNSELQTYCRALADYEGDVGTVSTISGTDALRDAYMRRANVKLETMESGAVAQVCAVKGVDYADLRVVSNFCGARNSTNHDFPGSIKQVSYVVRRFSEFLTNGETS